MDQLAHVIAQLNTILSSIANIERKMREMNDSVEEHNIKLVEMQEYTEEIVKQSKVVYSQISNSVERLRHK